jgi:hypothetical protein
LNVRCKIYTNVQDAREAEADVAVKQKRLDDGIQKLEDNKVRPARLEVYLIIRKKLLNMKLKSKSWTRLYKVSTITKLLSK